MKIHKKDKIIVTAGKDKGREGIVEKVYPKKGCVLVPGINKVKKHVRKTEKTPQGGIIEISKPINVSKVCIICPVCNKPTRVGYRIQDKKKFRICKKCKERI